MLLAKSVTILGTRGNGLCSQCFEKFYGPNCDRTCECDQGECLEGMDLQNITPIATLPHPGISGNGSCARCYHGNYGLYCNKTCSCNSKFGDCNEGTVLVTPAETITIKDNMLIFSRDRWNWSVQKL